MVAAAAGLAACAVIFRCAMLFDIAPKEETPARTPWWLTLLCSPWRWYHRRRGPFAIRRSRPCRRRTAALRERLGRRGGLGRAQRTGDLIARADAMAAAWICRCRTQPRISLETAAAAKARLRLIKPKPQTVERTEALASLDRFLSGAGDVELVWLSDGVDAGRTAEFIGALARLADKRTITVVDGGIRPAHALAAADNAAGVLTVKVLRPTTGGDDPGTVRALDLKGLPLGEAGYAFKSGDRETDAVLDLPVEIRNDIARLEIGGERSAGAVQLLDKRWRRRTVGVITGSTADTAQPFLASTFYLSRALSPFADIRLAERGSPGEAVAQFVEQRLPMIVLADVGNVAGDARDRLTRWIDEGGVLVRFAGPRLAASDDELVPVKLRRGGRILGGSLSWDQPQSLTAFSRESPAARVPSVR
jgi:hypothetical protein